MAGTYKGSVYRNLVNLICKLIIVYVIIVEADILVIWKTIVN